MRPRGIPTRYNGIQFRSRLEAKWAAFFDLCGWRWEYEPLDMDGYIPDFVLLFSQPLLVEVKPAFTLEEMRTHTGKIELSGWDKEALIVGNAPIRNICDYSLGLLWERDAYADPWSDALFFDCPKCRQLSLYHMAGSWWCRAQGCYRALCMTCEKLGRHSIDPTAFWREAGNETQWKKPRAARRA